MFEQEIKIFNEAQNIEWLETNGLGGWASSTILNCNTRSYHGIFVSPVNDPGNRFVFLSRLDESIKIGDKHHALSTRDFGDAISPSGYNYIKDFSNFPHPKWTFADNDFVLTKSIICPHGLNAVCIKYELEAQNACELTLEPFVNFRSYHAIRKSDSNLKLDILLRDQELKLGNFENQLDFTLRAPFYAYLHNPVWHNRFFLREESSRGLADREDLLSAGQLYCKISPNSPLYILIYSGTEIESDASKLFEDEVTRRKNIYSDCNFSDTTKITQIVNNLKFRADQFIIPRNNKKTVLAGYHWFTDWGRDTLISLRGLCIANGKINEAKDILELFCDHIKDGLIPNRFVEHGDTPDYNSVDASLWLGVVAYDFFKSDGDIKFVEEKLYPALKEIYEAFCAGTKYEIHEDSDGLIFAGNPDVQLTWMDAKIGDFVVTPRHGKAVEINALWYNLLNVLKLFSEQFNDPQLAAVLDEKIKIVKNSYEKTFYNEACGYLFDVVRNDFKDYSVRPNQIFATGLEFCPVSEKIAKEVIRIVKHELLTFRGLRTLSPADPSYKPNYYGSSFNRDIAYHQGTVWAWLLGLYIDSLFKFEKETARQEATQIIENLYGHLKEGCIGSISEIFDGDYPHYHKGTISQAWSVAEVLRVCLKYDLEAESCGAWSRAE